MVVLKQSAGAINGHLGNIFTFKFQRFPIRCPKALNETLPPDRQNLFNVGTPFGKDLLFVKFLSLLCSYRRRNRKDKCKNTPGPPQAAFHIHSRKLGWKQSRCIYSCAEACKTVRAPYPLAGAALVH